MTNVFEKRCPRVQAMKELFGNYLPPDQLITCPTCGQEHPRSVVCVLDSRFLMGSMSAAVSEKITLTIEYALRRRLPLIIFCASGGTRMQEGASPSPAADRLCRPLRHRADHRRKSPPRTSIRRSS